MKNAFYESEKYIFETSTGALPNKGILFVDHEKNFRSGHLGHAMVEYAPDKILCFYANCAGEPTEGHNAIGWMCYKRSLDGGKTWCEDKPLSYSKMLFEMNSGVTCFNEKAVIAPDGCIVLFNLVCCNRMMWDLWEPYWINTMRSYDEGKTWTTPKMFITNHQMNRLGRVYDAKTIGNKIYVLYCESDNATQGSNHFQIFVSDNNGDTFHHLSNLDFPTKDTFYGSLVVLDDGSLAVYVYNELDEKSLLCSISRDMGENWEKPFKVKFEKMIRNPQIVKFKDTFFCFGRSGNNDPFESQIDETKGHAVVYCSPDGINWDEGQYLRKRDAKCGSYSNTLIVGKGDKERLLYQSSFAYNEHRTNVIHWWIDAKKK